MKILKTAIFIALAGLLHLSAAIQGVGLFFYQEAETPPPSNGIYKTDFESGKTTLIWKPSNASQYISAIDISPDYRKFAVAVQGKSIDIDYAGISLA